MAQEWVYKATATIADLKNTSDLALREAFLAKAAYEKKDKRGQHAKADYVADVQLGDVIHFYFREPRTRADIALPIGSFEVINVSRTPGRFAWPVGGTQLAQVIDTVFATRLHKMGYGPDPKLGYITGWLLKHLDRAPPAYNRYWFPGNHVLRRYP